MNDTKNKLIDLIDWIYMNCGSFDALIYLLPIFVLFCAIYCIARAVWHKRKFGADFAIVRKKSRLNEFIRFLLVCWGVFIICGLLTPTEFWKYFWQCMVHGFEYNPFEDFFRAPRMPNPFPNLLSCILNGHPEWFFHSAHITDILLNISLFVTLGLALPFICKKAKLLKITLIGFSLSFVIEIVQIFLNGRWSNIDDLLCNTAGAALGYALYVLMKKVFPKFTAKCKLSANDVFQNLSNSDVQSDQP